MVINASINKKEISLISMEMQIKTTLRCHLTPVRMAIIKKTKKIIASVGEDVEKNEPSYLLVRWKLVQLLQKTVRSFLKNIKNWTTIQPKQFHFWVLVWIKQKHQFKKDICISRFTATWFTIATIWKQPKCPLIDEWIKKIYTGVGKSWLNYQPSLPKR